MQACSHARKSSCRSWSDGVCRVYVISMGHNTLIMMTLCYMSSKHVHPETHSCSCHMSETHASMSLSWLPIMIVQAVERSICICSGVPVPG